MLRSFPPPQSSSYTTKPVDYFRPLSVDVSVEYELPKEVAPPPGSAPLLIIHPSAYYKKQGLVPSPHHHHPTSILSPRSYPNSPIASSYYLRSSNAGAGGGGGTRSGAQRSSNVSRSRSTVSMAVGAERSSTKGAAAAAAAAATTTRRPCTDPSCDQCKDQNYTINYYGNGGATSSKDMMDMDLTTPTKVVTGGNKRLRMSQQQQQHQPLNLAVNDPSLYLGASLSYASNKPPPPHPTGAAAAAAAAGPPPPLIYGAANSTGIFQMINNVYAQNARLIKEGPKGSGSDSGVCSENESDVSPSTNNNHSRRSLFSHEPGASGCYCCCCPSGSDSSSTHHRHPITTASKPKPAPKGRSTRSNKTITNASTSSSNTMQNFHPSYNLNLGSPMDAADSCSSPVPGGYHHSRKSWFPPTPQDFGRWFQV